MVSGREAEVPLADVAGGVAGRFEHLGNRDFPAGMPARLRRRGIRGHAGTERVAAGEQAARDGEQTGAAA